MRVLPGWVISRCPPVDLPAEFPKPGNRRLFEPIGDVPPAEY